MAASRVDRRDLPAALQRGRDGRFRLRDRDAAATFGWRQEESYAATADNLRQLERLQYRMYADGRFALLIVLQAIDGGGKDSTIRRVFSAFNPQGCTVTSFKVPTALELRHDFLWRIHAHAPPRGEIAIFNRSHYEDVLVVRVAKLAPPAVWRARYAQINAFEKLLYDCNTRIVKLFLHISKDEQRRRFQERLAEAHKRWKFDPADLDKRRQWNAYARAFEAAINRCSTPHAPWYVIPADNKWFRDFAVS
ncbi:MAG: polyphosphate kinase 2 family protein, partial [Steroidobacteraceae bacterium]|nr:polyphosphate kinase 2 family protein [Steroidobacteraceae bacterium]